MGAEVTTGRPDRPETRPGGVEPVQQMAARLAGFLYLFTMATAIFAEIYVRGRIIADDGTGRAALNRAAFDQLFRLGIVADLVTFLGVVVLIWALHVILRPIDRNVARLAAFLRLVENAVAVAAIMNAFTAVRLLGGAAYLEPFEPRQLQALARLFISLQGAGLSIAFVFLGAGSAIFSWLWWKSRYVPRILAGWGIFSSLVMAIVTLAIVAFPRLGAIGLAYMAPMFLYEVGLGLWLLVKGLDAARPGESAAAA